MKAVSGRWPVTSAIVTQPSARPTSAATVVAAIATAKPARSVRTAIASRE